MFLVDVESWSRNEVVSSGCLSWTRTTVLVHSFQFWTHLCSMRIMGRNLRWRNTFQKKNPEKVCIRKLRLVGGLDASITIGTYFTCFDHSSSSEWQKLIACFFRVSLVCDDMMNVLCTRPNRHTMAQDNTLNGCWLYRRSIKSTLSVLALEEVCERIDFEQKWGWRSQQHIHLYLVGLEGWTVFLSCPVFSIQAEIGKAANTTRPGRRLNISRVR